MSNWGKQDKLEPNKNNWASRKITYHFQKTDGDGQFLILDGTNSCQHDAYYVFMCFSKI